MSEYYVATVEGIRPCTAK